MCVFLYGLWCVLCSVCCLVWSALCGLCVSTPTCILIITHPPLYPQHTHHNTPPQHPHTSNCTSEARGIARLSAHSTSSRSWVSGNPQYTNLSRRPGRKRAASMRSGLLVAAITDTPVGIEGGEYVIVCVCVCECVCVFVMCSWVCLYVYLGVFIVHVHECHMHQHALSLYVYTHTHKKTPGTLPTPLPCNPSTPSNSVNSWLTTRSLTPVLSCPRCGAMLSNSSKNKQHGAAACAFLFVWFFVCVYCVYCVCVCVCTMQYQA